jgi:hypothetical protein
MKKSCKNCKHFDSDRQWCEPGPDCGVGLLKFEPVEICQEAKPLTLSRESIAIIVENRDLTWDETIDAIMALWITDVAMPPDQSARIAELEMMLELANDVPERKEFVYLQELRQKERGQRDRLLAALQKLRGYSPLCISSHPGYNEAIENIDTLIREVCQSMGEKNDRPPETGPDRVNG